MRPIQDPVKPLRVLFLDSKTGAGFTSTGHKVDPTMGGRRTATPSLEDILDTAASYGAQMVLLTGKGLKPAKDGRSWVTAPTREWVHGNHWIKGENVTGRYTSVDGTRKIDVGLCSNWFGSVPVNAAQAQKAWAGLNYYIGLVEPRQSLMKTPSKTGSYLWGFAIQKKFDTPPLDGYMAELLHSTSGQGHIEHLVAGDYAAKHPDCIPLIDPEKTPFIEQYANIDGRSMYASVCNELGTGPIHELRQSEAADLWQNNKYAHARYRVNIQVPRDWNHVGVLGMKDGSNRDTWLYPNRPGARFETWADHRELIVADRNGWIIQPLEALKFTEKMRPLDVFSDWIVRLNKTIEERAGAGGDPMIPKAAKAAMRGILVQGIGRFAMRGRSTMLLTDDLDAVPGEAVASVTELPGGQFSYEVWDGLADRDLPYYHPELAVQVWGWARANVLDSRTASGHKTGALHVDPSTLIAIETDAIHTSSLPRWAAPAAMGGADDGAVGRLRLKGYAKGRIKTPVTLEERHDLRRKAEKTDLTTAWDGAGNE